MSEHIVPVRTYLKVFFALLILTAVTTAVAFVDLGPLNDVVALSIAGTKALLVVLIFMHVRWQSRLVWIFALAGLFWLLILFALTLADYVTRLGVPGWS